MKRTIVLLATMLLSFGLISAQEPNAVDIDIVTPDGTDTLRIGVAAALDIYMANDYILGGLTLGIQVWADGDAAWSWEGGHAHGASGYVSSEYGRMGDGSVFDMTGLLITEQDIDGLARDTILAGGVALMVGMPTGDLEHQYSYHFIPDGESDPAGHICFDSAFVPPAGPWAFVDVDGNAAPPINMWQYGSKCWPVAPSRNWCPQFDQGIPTAMMMGHCESECVTISANDDLDDPPDAIVFDGGTLIGGSGIATVVDNGDGTATVCYAAACADVGQAITIEVGVKDVFHEFADCGTHTITVTVVNAPPEITNCPTEVLQVGKGNAISYDLDATDPDPCDVLTWAMCGDSPGDVDVDGVWSWATTDLDVGIHSVCVEVTDCAGEIAQCQFTVDVLAVEPWMIKIEKVHDAYLGHYVDVDICINKGSEIVGGFDFLIAYDASALAFTGAELSDWLVSCRWEYFTYRYSWNGNCGNQCPSGLLRLVGMAETNNGPFHPDDDCLAQAESADDCYGCGSVIATLTFFLSADRTLQCMFIPVRWYWMDCADNALSTMSGDTMAVNRYVWDYVGCSYERIDHLVDGFPSWYGVHDGCLVGDKVEPVRFVDYCNGGVDVICDTAIDARGDINVNGLVYEIADAVMLTNYFISGLSAFADHVEASRAASDVNADGIALSVADLVYLIRVIIGDANPYPKPVPETPVTISAQGGKITYDSPVDVGAALLTFQVNGEIGAPQLGSGAATMDMKYAREGNQLRVLIYNIGSEMIAAGENVLITIPGQVELTGAEVATYDGFGLDALVRNLPQQFTVTNYPNPFNPSTTIKIELPDASDWSVKIYNVAGQIVTDYSGFAEAGIHNVVWNGTNNVGNKVASGIYFYKAQVGQYTATRKMILMK